MSSEDTYLSIKSEASSLLKEKGSKFIGYAAPVESEENVNEALDLIRKKYHDATHNCWAYRIGLGDEARERSSDDGEPSGSAGVPMLKVLEGAELTNILVIVTRYYGGKKLGVGGLARAYGGCVKLLIENTGVIENTITEAVALLIDYAYLNSVMRVAASFDAKIQQEEHENEKALLTLSVRRSVVGKLKKELIEATKGSVEFK